MVGSRAIRKALSDGKMALNWDGSMLIVCCNLMVSGKRIMRL